MGLLYGDLGKALPGRAQFLKRTELPVARDTRENTANSKQWVLLTFEASPHCPPTPPCSA